MSRWLKLTLKIIGILVCLFLILWMAVAAYVYSNKKELLQTISSQLNENLSGRLTIEKMEPSLIQGFPGISVSLENILLRDSLWDKHKHDLLRAKNIYIAINAFSILSGSPTIKDVRIKDGALYLFTDTSGVRNTDIFRRRTKKEKREEGTSGRINRVFLDQVTVTVDDRRKNKLFEFSVNNFLGSIHYTPDGWKSHIKLDTRVETFAFNVKKGSFLKDKRLVMDLDLLYNDASHVLSIPSQDILIENNTFNLGGKFTFAKDNSDYELNIVAPAILLKDAKSLLSSHISNILKPYDIQKPIKAGAFLKGELEAGGDPYIEVSWDVKNNVLTSRGERITDCSFTGSYINEWIKGRERNDPNSVIRFNNMKGKIYDIPFLADSIRISDLKKPVFAGRFRSSFPLSKLNPVLGGGTFVFTTGKADVDLIYKAPFNKDDLGQRFIYGTIEFHDAKASYKPRNLALSNMNLVMNFKGRDLYIDDLRLKSGSSSLAMEGSIKDFSNLYYSDPQKMMVNWKVRSPQINLNEFIAFLGARGAVKNSSAKKTSVNLERMLELAAMNMNVQVNKVIYKKFVATNVNAAIVLNQRGVTINNINLRQGGGTVSVNGKIDQSGPVNSFHINSKINNVNVEQLFRAFDNFGQDAITSQNLRGTFFGGTDISGSIRSNGEIIPRSFKGTVDFDIRNGGLVNFEPMTKVGNFAFPRRNFSDIRFTSLKNKLNIQGNKVYIPPMEIRSSVLNIFVDGVYSFTTGTNIGIKVPLRNPEKDNEITDRQLRKERALKGIVINVRALDGDDGKVKFRLGKKTPEGYE